MNVCITGDMSAESRAVAELAVLSARLTRIAQRFAHAHEDVLGLTQPEYRTLRAISRRGPQRMKRLADRQLLSSQTMSQTVDRLVVAGLATRTEDSVDRRHLQIDATPAGLERLDAYEHAFEQYLEGALDELDESESAEIAAALTRLNEALAAKRDGGYFRTQREALHA